VTLYGKCNVCVPCDLNQAKRLLWVMGQASVG
jgi:hypothetical protein